MILDIILATLTTVLGFLSIAGNTWNENGATLFSKLTGRGWASVACLIAILAVGVVSYFNTEKEKKELKDLVKKAAHEKLNASNLIGIGAGITLQNIENQFGPPSKKGLQLTDCSFGKNASISCWGNDNYSIQAVANAQGEVQALTIFQLGDSREPYRVYKESNWVVGYSSYDDIHSTPISSHREIVDFGRHQMYWEYFRGSRSDYDSDYILASYVDGVGIDALDKALNTFDRSSNKPRHVTSFNETPEFSDYDEVHEGEWFRFVVNQTLDEGF